jgi:opacity protein-like surface antigen
VTVAWVACLLGLGAGAGVERAAPPPDSAEITRSGLYGLGLGIEAPIVGVLTGKGERSDLGSGYALGFGLSWEVVPAIEILAAYAGGQTYGSRAPVRYRNAGNVVQRRQNAEWSGEGATLGAAYLWNEVDRPWSPYVGADVGVHDAGYSFRFNKDLRETLEPPAASQPSDCRGDDCQASLHDSARLSWNAGARLGVRYRMLSWLSTLAEVSLTYAPVGAGHIDATLGAREARAVAEQLWLVRGVFAVRLGL